MLTASFFTSRIRLLERKLKSQKIESFLVSNPVNLNYLTGLGNLGNQDRQAFLLLSPKTSLLFISPLLLYPGRTKIFTPVILKRRGQLCEQINLLSVENKAESLAFESLDLKVAELENFQKKIKPKLVSTRDIIENLRQVKDSLEINKLSQACEISKKIFKTISHQLTPGQTEKEIAKMIIDLATEYGADGIPDGFPPLVAGGSNSAIPHHQTGNRKLQKNDVLLLDFGCLYQGYCSDMSRTLKLGNHSDRFTKVEKSVQAAYQKVLTEISINTSIKQISSKVRKLLIKRGYSGKMPHALGHGLGLQIHELPQISVKTPKNLKLKAGMTIAIEPAVYLPGEFGYRYENTILLTKQGVKTLT